MAEAQQKAYGRVPTFHDTEAAYVLPNDSDEHTRLVSQHNAVVSLCKNRIIHAPLAGSPSKIVDVGCGTGIVTRCLASQFPDTPQIYGVDISPVPPQPGDDQFPHLNFLRGDFRHLAGVHEKLEWGSAGYIFSRFLLCGMTDWPGYVGSVFRMLKPGAWAEMVDYVEDTFYPEQNSVPISTAYIDGSAKYKNGKQIVPRRDWEWLRAIRHAGQCKGLDLDAGLNIPAYMKAAGFEEVQTWSYRIPFWREAAMEEVPEAKEIIEHSIDDKYGMYWHMIPKLLEGMSYTEHDVERLRQMAKADLKEERGKEQIFCVTIGKKPER